MPLHHARHLHVYKPLEKVDQIALTTATVDIICNDVLRGEAWQT